MSIGSAIAYYRVAIFYYLVGGLTFLPLCIGLLLGWFFLTAPHMQDGNTTTAADEPLGDVEFTEERKREALDLAVSNAEARRQAEKEIGQEEAIGSSTAPAAAKRLKPPPKAPSAKPHRAGWLVVRRQFGSNSSTAGQFGNEDVASSLSSTAKLAADGNLTNTLKSSNGEKGPGYMSTLYRGMLKYRANKNAEQQLRGEESSGRSGTTTPEQGHEENKTEKASAKSSTAGDSSPAAVVTAKQAAGTGSRESFFCILKGPVLYLYSSDDTNNSATECHAAIDLRSKRVSLYIAHLGDTMGEPDEFEEEEFAADADPETSAVSENDGLSGSRSKVNWRKAKRATIRDGELFTKRNAVRIVSTAGTNKANGKRRYAQWFVFCRSATMLEDWYHALLHASMLTDTTSDPIPDLVGPVFSPMDMVSLLTSLDTLPDPIPLRWLNALVGRIFFSIYRTAWLEDYVTNKIMKKISRVKTPGFLSDIRVQEVDLGRSPPAFSRPMLKSLTGTGEASMEVAIHYSGSLRLTISTVLTISLGSRFKPYNVPLVLAVIINSLEGNLLLHIKPPPSNRIWFGFTKLPKMDISVEPVVSERKVQWSMVTRLIESRIRELMTESLVVPNMDDIPFFDTRPLSRRGGIWADASKRRDQSTATAAAVATTNETPLEQKSKSTPASVLDIPVGDAEAKSTAMRADEERLGGELKRRVQSANESAPSPSPPVLSSSPAAAGLSTLLARDMARDQSQTEVGDVGRSANSGSSSKRRSWFIGRSSTAGQSPAQAVNSSTAGTKVPTGQQSSLAWGNASLSIPTAAEQERSSRSAPASTIEGAILDAPTPTPPTHKKDDSISSIKTTASSIASADTEELHNSFAAALNEEDVTEDTDPKTPMADVPNLVLDESGDSNVTVGAERRPETDEDDLTIPVHLSPERRSLNDEAGIDEVEQQAEVAPETVPRIPARPIPSHGFAPPPSRGATVRRLNENENRQAVSPQPNLRSEPPRSPMSIQRDRQSLSPALTRLEDDSSSIRSANTSSAALLNTWNKAKASMADKDSRQAAAKEAKDALKRGWASWNAKRNGNEAGIGSDRLEQLPTSSDRLGEASPSIDERFGSGTSSWLGSSPQDPASLSVGFSVRAGRQGSPVSTANMEQHDSSIADLARTSRRQEQEGNSSRASSASGRAPYKEYRASKGKGQGQQSESVSGTSSPPTPSLPASGKWEAAVSSVATPVPAARRSVSNGSTQQHTPEAERQAMISSSPSSIRKWSNTDVRTGAADGSGGSNYSFAPGQGQATTSITRADMAAQLGGEAFGKISTLPESPSLSAADTSEVNKVAMLTERWPSSATNTADPASSTSRHSPSSPAVGIKQQPTRAAMMAVPGIPSVHKTSPQSFSAVPELKANSSTAEKSNNSNALTSSPRLGLQTLISRMPSFGTSSAPSSHQTPAPNVIAPAILPAAVSVSSSEAGSQPTNTSAPVIASMDEATHPSNLGTDSTVQKAGDEESLMGRGMPEKHSAQGADTIDTRHGNGEGKQTKISAEVRLGVAQANE